MISAGCQKRFCVTLDKSNAILWHMAQEKTGIAVMTIPEFIEAAFYPFTSLCEEDEGVSPSFFETADRKRKN